MRVVGAFMALNIDYCYVKKY